MPGRAKAYPNVASGTSSPMLFLGEMGWKCSVTIWPQWGASDIEAAEETAKTPCLRCDVLAIDVIRIRTGCANPDLGYEVFEFQGG